MDPSSSRNSLSSETPIPSSREEELLRQARAGDKAAFLELAEPYRERLYATAYRLLGSREDAAEICQETFLRTFWKIAGFQGRASFYTWLYRIALNLCYRRMAKKRREVVEETAGEQLPDPGASPRDRAILQERAALVRRALSQLAPADFEILVLREFEELPYEEMARRLGLPEGTVMSRLHRARAALAGRLQRLGISK
jgi:RNA polymerase sigma-70 factor (ECF subfamily)